MAQGFSSLVSAARNDGYVEEVVAGVASIVHLAAGNDSEYTVTPVELYPEAVPEFLNVVSMVSTKSSFGNPDGRKLLLDFSEDVLRLLYVASGDEESKRFIVEHSAYHDLHSALEAAAVDDATQQILQKVEKLGTDLGIEYPGNVPLPLSEDAEQASISTQQDTLSGSLAENGNG
ncbi:hypothetical protein FRC07_007554 [Ceratobasidium sp. 392]|nr:hypothetical protein FRC07_007554 [Ceratobasidium sp. 392]